MSGTRCFHLGHAHFLSPDQQRNIHPEMLLPNVDVVSLLDEVVTSLVEFGQFRQQRVHMLLNYLELVTSFHTVHFHNKEKTTRLKNAPRVGSALCFAAGELWHVVQDRLALVSHGPMRHRRHHRRHCDIIAGRHRHCWQRSLQHSQEDTQHHAKVN